MVVCIFSHLKCCFTILELLPRSYNRIEELTLLPNVTQLCLKWMGLLVQLLPIFQKWSNIIFSAFQINYQIIPIFINFALLPLNLLQIICIGKSLNNLCLFVQSINIHWFSLQLKSFNSVVINDKTWQKGKTTSDKIISFQWSCSEFFKKKLKTDKAFSSQ